MKLSNEEVKLFYKLRDGLYHFINKKFHIIKNLTTPDFNGQYAEEVARLDDKLSSYPHMVDEFVKENPLRFNQTELNIVSQWKKLVKGDFYILHEKEKSVFLGDESKAYHVYGLQDEIRDILPFEPYMAKTILFPFCGKIVYSSILNGYNMTFGRGMVDALSRDYIKAKSKFGLIESLDEPLNEKEESSEELLRFYLKNENNRMRNWDEIHRLLKKNLI